MLERLYRLANRLLLLTRDTHENKTNLKKLEERLDKLSGVVRDLAYEVRRVRETDAHEREKMALQLENSLLRFERELRSGPLALGPGHGEESSEPN